jgi:hypothetical protein
VLWGLNLPLVAELLRSFDPLFLSPVRQTLSFDAGGLVSVTLGVAQLRSPIPLAAHRHHERLGRNLPAVVQPGTDVLPPDHRGRGARRRTRSTWGSCRG